MWTRWWLILSTVGPPPSTTSIPIPPPASSTAPPYNGGGGYGGGGSVPPSGVTLSLSSSAASATSSSSAAGVTVSLSGVTLVPSNAASFSGAGGVTVSLSGVTLLPSSVGSSTAPPGYGGQTTLTLSGATLSASFPGYGGSGIPLSPASMSMSMPMVSSVAQASSMAMSLMSSGMAASSASSSPAMSVPKPSSGSSSMPSSMLSSSKPASIATSMSTPMASSVAASTPVSVALSSGASAGSSAATSPHSVASSAAAGSSAGLPPPYSAPPAPSTASLAASSATSVASLPVSVSSSMSSGPAPAFSSGTPVASSGSVSASMSMSMSMMGPSASKASSSAGPGAVSSSAAVSSTASPSAAASRSKSIAMSSISLPPPSSNVPASTVSAPQPTGSGHICPQNNGTNFVSPCGSVYTLQCGIDHHGGDLPAPNGVYVSSFDECVGLCDARPACVDAAWREGAPQGSCYLKGTVGFTVSDTIVWTGEQVSYGPKCANLPSMISSASSASSSSSAAASSSTVVAMSSSSAPPVVGSSSKSSPMASPSTSSLMMAGSNSGPPAYGVTSSPGSPKASSSSQMMQSSSMTSSSTAAASVSHRPVPGTKRGLVSFDGMMGDYAVWIQPGSPLSWYYNYGSTPYAQFANSQMQYVPMLFGNNAVNFTAAVLSLINQGYNITWVLGFNEPDQATQYGGSAIDPATAAARWKSDIEPLKQYGIHLGAPSISYNVTWLQDFFQFCSGCHIDFIPFHWYGPLYSATQGAGFYDRYYQLKGTFPSATFWLTEWADPNDNLASTQSNYNGILQFVESEAAIEKYSYFGSFRSYTSNVGYNATLLDSCGLLTDIGDNYMNRSAEGHIPGPNPCLLASVSSLLPSSTATAVLSSSKAPASSVVPSSLPTPSSSIVPSTSTSVSVQVIVSTVQVTPVPASSSVSPSPSCLPAYQGAIDCNAGADGQIYTSQSGAQFKIACGINYAGGDMPNPNGQYVDSLAVCMDTCALRQGCVAIDWVPSSPQGACYLKQNIGEAQNTGSVFGAVLVNPGPCSGHVSTSGTPVTGAPFTTAAPSSTIASSSFAPTSTGLPPGCDPSPTSLLHLPTPTPVLYCITNDESLQYDDAVASFNSPFPLKLYASTSSVIFLSANGVSFPPRSLLSSC